MTKVHDLKIHPKYFEPVAAGKKRAEVRINDRDYNAGDTLILREYDPKKGFTGQKVVALITDATCLRAFVDNGAPYILLSIQLVERPAISGCKLRRWNELAVQGLVFRINYEVLHPQGLAMMYDPETGVSDGALVASDGVWSYSGEIIKCAKQKGWM
ncbi:TPA: DUF3850 domain-containing protein [Salmonella enterica subsp. enterica serovar Typhimurium]|nr:DUF3850 domain-containing protein [Salmonella enterica subsp. enterica serovar Typhimurium]